MCQTTCKTCDNQNIPHIQDNAFPEQSNNLNHSKPNPLYIVNNTTNFWYMPSLLCREVCCLTSAVTVTTEHWLAVKTNVVEYITPVKNDNVNIIKLHLFQRRVNFNVAAPRNRN